MDSKIVALIIVFVFAAILFLLTSGVWSGVSRLNGDVTTLEDDIQTVTDSNSSLQTRTNNVSSKVSNLTSSGKDSSFVKDVNVSIELYDDGTPILSSIKSLDNFVETGIFTTNKISLISVNSTGSSNLSQVENVGTVTTNYLNAGGTSEINILKTSLCVTSLTVPCGYYIYSTINGMTPSTSNDAEISGIYIIIGTLNHTYSTQDCFYVVNPGFRFKTYTEYGFKGSSYEYDNTNGLLPLCVPSQKITTLHSLHVYYKGVEFIPFEIFGIN